MVKNDSLSDDIGFVKEFEELKLKQKLLIESLNNKNKTEMNQFLLDINSKLDFLVKIFKESQNDDEEQNEFEVKLDSKISDLIKKVDSFDKKFEELDSKLSSLDTNYLKSEELIQKEIKNININVPKPDFKVDSKVQLKDEVKIETDKVKKRKWF